MKIKVSEATGRQLDLLVDMAQNQTYWAQLKLNAAGGEIGGWNTPPDYSTNWAQGGPIIERERLLIQPEIGKEGCGNAWSAIAITGFEMYGPTPLIAAMRCFVASKLGDEVEIPKELT